MFTNHLFSGFAATETYKLLTLCGRNGPTHYVVTAPDGETNCEECALIRALKDPKNKALIDGALADLAAERAAKENAHA